MGVPSGGAIEMQNKKIPQKLIPWLEAKKRHRLSDMHVQMARELGMNPKKLGKLDNHKQEPWKLPLPQFIEKCYLKSFKRPRPEKVVPLSAKPRATASKQSQKAPAEPQEAKAPSPPGMDVSARHPDDDVGWEEVPF
jgi:hypothetical protein